MSKLIEELVKLKKMDVQMIDINAAIALIKKHQITAEQLIDIAIKLNPPFYIDPRIAKVMAKVLTEL